MAFASVSDPLRRHYDDYYDGTSEWRRLGALDKAANLVRLCGANPHESVLEIGAGEGALLARLAELRFGSELHGLDVSRSGVEAARARDIPGLASCAVFDGDTVPFEDDRFDLAILCHVLEHAEHPRRLLAEAARVARRVFVEIPLEDTWRLPRDYAPDAVGHINFYTAKSVRRLVQSCGLEVRAQIVTNPSRGCQAWGSPARGSLRWVVKELALRAAPALAGRLFTYHGALLCESPR